MIDPGLKQYIEDSSVRNAGCFFPWEHRNFDSMVKAAGLIDAYRYLNPGKREYTYFFQNLHVVPREMYGVRLMLGAELNILDTSGRLDLEPFYYRMMDIRIGGIHSLCWKGGTKEENTNAMVTAIHNPWLQMVTYPGDGTAELEFLPIVVVAKETGTILEINNSSLNPVRKKVKAIDNNIEILRLCKQYEVPVLLGSDAHISFAIANYDNIYPLLAETEFPDDLILNYKSEPFLKDLKKSPE